MKTPPAILLVAAAVFCAGCNSRVVRDSAEAMAMQSYGQKLEQGRMTQSEYDKARDEIRRSQPADPKR